MSKLPPEFVKAPSAAPVASKPKSRKSRKASIVSAPAEAAPVDPRDLVLRLTDEELSALEEARQALIAAGESVTLEQMLHRVLADWSQRQHAVATTTTTEPTPVMHRDERLVDRIRAFAASPLRTWRELGATLRRMSRLAKI